MAQIKIDFDALMDKASAIQNCTQEYSALMGRMKNMAATIGENWEGEASRAFAAMMSKYNMEAAKMTDVLEGVRKYAADVVTDVQELDQRCAGRIRGSF